MREYYIEMLTRLRLLLEMYPSLSPYIRPQIAQVESICKAYGDEPPRKL